MEAFMEVEVCGSFHAFIFFPRQFVEAPMQVSLLPWKWFTSMEVCGIFNGATWKLTLLVGVCGK